MTLTRLWNWYVLAPLMQRGFYRVRGSDYFRNGYFTLCWWRTLRCARKELVPIGHGPVGGPMTHEWSIRYVVWPPSRWERIGWSLEAAFSPRLRRIARHTDAASRLAHAHQSWRNEPCEVRDATYSVMYSLTLAA